jgi:hypothetical protein
MTSKDVELIRTSYTKIEKRITSINTNELKTLDNFNTEINQQISKLNKLFTQAGKYIKKIEGEQIAKAKAAKAATAKK